jgi:hypothetical protein
MSIFNGLFPNIGPVWHTFWFIFSHGGWVVFVLLTILILYKLYLNEVQEQYIASLEWIIYEIKVPKENLTSFYSVEQIFTQLHGLHDAITFAERYVEGKVLLWMSFEIVSLGGQISFIVRAPRKARDFIEATFYAQYPNAVLTEVNDYLENFEFNPDDPKYSFFGSEFVPVSDESIPLRTYRDMEMFKSADEKETVVDPLGPLFESFTHISPSEFYGFQMVIRLPSDKHLKQWREKADAKIKELLGERKFMELDDITKEQINGIQRKLSKPAYETKFRLLQIGQSDTFNANAKRMLLSIVKMFASSNGNVLKPAYATKLDYRISPTLEAPYINYYVRQRKIQLFKGYKSRSTYLGKDMFILNAEELATLWHLPISTDVPVSTIQTQDSKKLQPPANLPIG